MNRDELREEFDKSHNYSIKDEAKYRKDYTTWLEDKVISIQERLDLQILANDNLYVDNKELIKELKEFGGGRLMNRETKNIPFVVYIALANIMLIACVLILKFCEG
jgi:hypothetical protein